MCAIGCRPSPGTELKVRGLGRIALECLLERQGGFGTVYRGCCSKRGREDFPVAVKFLKLGGMRPDYTDEMRGKNMKRFRHEMQMLKYFDGEIGDPFPAFLGSGKYYGIPFFVMEWLEPVNLDELDTNDKRLKYISGLCYAVLCLHNGGYVHYDIKPGNILARENAGEKVYVLADFGSVHKIEDHGNGGRIDNPHSISLLKDGRRMLPHTPGYADPEDDLHTVNADIYSIGQVIRDLFPSDVPPGWAQVINKCTSRRREYRYKNVEEIQEDIEKLRVKEYSLAADDDLRIWKTQKAVVREKVEEMFWDDLRWLLLGQRMSLDEDYPFPAGVNAPVSELLIDFGKLEHRNIRIKEPVRMTESALLVIRGNGRISIDLDGTGTSDIDVFSHAEETGWDEPIYPFVILLDGASLDNRTKLDNDEAGVMYMVGRYCMLNFSSRNEAEEAEDPRFILKGRAGYSFVGNGGRNWKNGLYGLLEDGNKRLFAQQKWDTLDLPSLLKTLRKIRSVNSQGDVQRWLRINAKNVLMRNLGRYG